METGQSTQVTASNISNQSRQINGPSAERTVLLHDLDNKTYRRIEDVALCLWTLKSHMFFLGTSLVQEDGEEHPPEASAEGRREGDHRDHREERVRSRCQWPDHAWSEDHFQLQALNLVGLIVSSWDATMEWITRLAQVHVLQCFGLFRCVLIIFEPCRRW